MTVMKNRYKGICISLDDVSIERCTHLADEWSTSMSGVMRTLLKREYERSVRNSEKEAAIAL